MPAPGDYDGDGQTDFAVWRPAEGNWYVIHSSTDQTSVQQWGLPGDMPVPADYDADGRTDFAIWRPVDGRWYVIASATGTMMVQQWGLRGDVPAPGDYDADGRTDFAVWRPADGKRPATAYCGTVLMQVSRSPQRIASTPAARVARPS